MFTDREDAGRQLADLLRAGLKGRDALVLGVPRGGVVVAAEVARALGLELDVVIASKLGAPGQPEYAVGAVDADGDVSIVSGMRLPPGYIEQEAEARLAEVHRRQEMYRQGRPAPGVRDRVVVVVDDGIATGLTIRKAVEYLRRHHAAHVIVAVPVASAATARQMRDEGLDLVVMKEPAHFSAVGQFYREFDQTSDAEVLALLDATMGPESCPP
ncbi:MAG: phosphoribosyltransferase [Coriobacteriia bacterium]|nr:phosphoribosyltransferase [Coriobacteriia bacterium]MBN2823170.1 phosphoribosyltransferase [Coriobacteriia bacterium]